MSTGQSDRGNSLTEFTSSQIDYQINIVWNCTLSYFIEPTTNQCREQEAVQCLALNGTSTSHARIHACHRSRVAHCKSHRQQPSTEKHCSPRHTSAIIHIDAKWRWLLVLRSAQGQASQNPRGKAHEVLAPVYCKCLNLREIFKKWESKR